MRPLAGIGEGVNPDFGLGRGEGPAAYQLDGEVTAPHGDDG